MPPSTRGPATDRERSLSVLVRRFAADAARLLRQEIALVRAELRQAAARMAGAASRVAIGAGVGAVGGLTLIAAVVILLGGLIGSYWLATLVVAAVLLAMGAWIALTGTRRFRTIDPAPRGTVASLQTTARWARGEAREVGSSIRGGERRPAADRLARAASETPPQPAGELVPPRSATPLAPAHAPRRRNATAAGFVTPAGGGEAGSASVDRPRGPKRQPPPRRLGTLAFLNHLRAEIKEDEVQGHAAKLAYYAFISMPPAIMALFGLAGLVGSERIATSLQRQAAVAMPADVSESIIGPFIEQVVLQKAPGPLSIGLILALWGGSSIFLGLMETLNHAYDLEETRSFMKKRATAIAIMMGSLLLFLVAAGALLVGPALVDAIGLGPTGELAWSILQWPLAFTFMVAAFWCSYYFLPDRDQSASRGVLLKAAAVAAALWVLATAAFRLYIANFSLYSETYGFLGAFIILLLWLYVTGLVVLAGGELASEMERRAE